MATRGRRPGALSNYTCCECGATEMVSGGNHTFRCVACRNKPRIHGGSAFSAIRGKAHAGAVVQAAIKAGRLARPTTFACEDCDRPAKFYDHRDYNQPLKVAPVCHSCNLKRGPAIPVCGAIEAIVAKGAVPFALHLRTEQLLRTMGLPTDALADMPARLDITHWRALLPLFQQQAA